ncbi:MAG TPA: VWA domain-containing protein [Candidatus Acidoferrales bacterium]|nr:VWA domain-containing protein [Candidatus Acidoferrales bacterium]
MIAAGAICLGLTFSISAVAYSQRRSAPQIRVGVNLVLVDATVRDASGKPMDNLNKDSFILRDNGVVQKIDYFGRDELPLSVALVLDLSSSIQPFLDALRESASTTLATLKPDDRVALFTFSGSVDLRMQLTNDTSKITSELVGLKAGGSTNIKDALFEAASYLLVVKPKGRRVIVLISDDVGTESGQHSEREIVDEVLEADASLYNLKISGENPRRLNSNLNVAKIAQETGGEVLDAAGSSAFAPAFRVLIQKIRSRYTIGYYVTASSADNKEHKLDVRLAPSFGTRGKDYSLLSKRGYYFLTGAFATEGHRDIGHQDSWTGAVLATNDSERTITLSSAIREKTETFTATLPEGYKVKMSDGSIQDLKPSEIATGRRITVYYTRTIEKYFGKDTPTNQIYWIDFVK